VVEHMVMMSLNEYECPPLSVLTGQRSSRFRQASTAPHKCHLRQTEVYQNVICI
jgi:hypothetical protein